MKLPGQPLEAVRAQRAASAAISEQIAAALRRVADRWEARVDRCAAGGNDPRNIDLSRVLREVAEELAPTRTGRPRREK